MKIFYRMDPFSLARYVVPWSEPIQFSTPLPSMVNVDRIDASSTQSIAAQCIDRRIYTQRYRRACLVYRTLGVDLLVNVTLAVVETPSSSGIPRPPAVAAPFLLAPPPFPAKSAT